MKMFRLVFAGVVPAFVLFVCFQLDVRAASTSPPPPGMQCWFTGDDAVNQHIWHGIGTLFDEFLKEHRKVEEQSSQIAKQDRKIENLETTVAQLETALKAQAGKIQKVSNQLKKQDLSPRVVVDN
jgi:peptidoglycan hydrolase CwlO-like protein